MKKLIGFLVAGLVLGSGPTVSACGDKILHLHRLHRMKSKPASVVVYSRPDSLVDGTSLERVSKALQEAGHRLTLVKSERDLRAALQAGVAEVLIADLSDAGSLPGSLGVRPSVVAVVAKSDREGMVSAKRFDAVLKVPAKADNYLDAVDRALQARSKNAKTSRNH